MSPARARADRGFAVLAALLVLVALMGLAHAALVTAEREMRTSGVEASLVARRMAARGAADAPLPSDSLPPRGAPPLVLASGSGGALRWRTEAGRIDREIGLVSGLAWTERIPGEDRIGVLVWSLDPVARIASAVGVVEEGGTASVRVGGVRADRWSVALDDGLGSGSCFAELRALDSIGTLPPAPTGRIPAEPPALGFLAFDSLLARAETRRSGVVELTPDAAALLGSEGDLTLTGGHGSGVIVTRGTLRLEGDARFDGVVLVGGSLVVEATARLRGWARVAGDVRIAGGGSVEGSACAATIALRELPVLRAPVRLPEPRIHPM